MAAIAFGLLLNGHLCAMAPSKASTLGQRISKMRINPQAAKQCAKKIWYGSEAEQASSATKAGPIASKAKPSAASKMAAQYTKFQRSPQIQNLKEQGQQSWKFAKKNPLNVLVPAVTLAAILGMENIADFINEAEEIIAAAKKSFNMNSFDENLISEKFTNAIARIYNVYEEDLNNIPAGYDSQGSAIIIKSDEHPDFYFVLTAAHCLRPFGYHFVHLQHTGRDAHIEITPLIIDRENDIAVLWILPKDIRDFEKGTETRVPFVPLSQLTEVKPHKEEILMLKGFPSLGKKLPEKLKKREIYSTKIVHEGPSKMSIPNQIRRLEERTLERLYPENTFKPYLKLAIPETPYNLDAESRMSWQEKQDLAGASGSPVIALRDKQPVVMGVFTAQGAQDPNRLKASGVGYLPRYLQEAEKSAQEIITGKAAQEKARQDEEKARQELLKKKEWSWPNIARWLGLSS